jgi:hypothetical protein
MKDSQPTPFSAERPITSPIALPIALTAGDPAGIGPELVLRFLQA